MRLFKRKSAFDLWTRVRELGPPDWSRVDAQLRLFDNNRQIGAENGWFVDTPWSRYSSDQPCTVFLSLFGLYVDVRPDASLLGPELITISPYVVQKAGVGVSDVGACRLVVMYAQNDELKGIAVDFEPTHREFAEQLANWAEQASGFWQSDEAQQALDEIRPDSEGRS